MKITDTQRWVDLLHTARLKVLNATEKTTHTIDSSRNVTVHGTVITLYVYGTENYPKHKIDGGRVGKGGHILLETEAYTPEDAVKLMDLRVAQAADQHSIVLAEWDSWGQHIGKPVRQLKPLRVPSIPTAKLNGASESGLRYGQRHTIPPGTEATLVGMDKGILHIKYATPQTDQGWLVVPTEWWMWDSYRIDSDNRKIPDPYFEIC